MRLRHRSYRATIVMALAVAASAGCGDEIQPTTGPTAAPRAAVAAAVGHPGQWSGLFFWPVQAAHLIALPDGKVLSWHTDDESHEHAGTDSVALWQRTPGSVTGGAFTIVPNTDSDIFCAGHAFLPDGSLMVSGGHSSGYHGLKDANIFNWRSGTWGRATAMNGAHWYPSDVTLATGEIVTVGGYDEHGAHNLISEVWTGSGWRALTGAPLPSGTSDVAWYPWVHLAPDGRVFKSGPDRISHFLNTAGTGSWTTHLTSNHGDREQGTSVMYLPGKVLIVGGGGGVDNSPVGPTATAETIDLNTGGSWSYTGSMAHARRQLNATLLADGKVLVTGGTSASGKSNAAGAQYSAELWDPTTGSWTELAPMAIDRLYHSTAVLLSDARVLVAGGEYDFLVNKKLNAEIFTPPYLLNADGTLAARPSITAAPQGSVGYGQTFSVQTPEAQDISKVTLVRLGAATHAFNQNQRFDVLAFTKGTGALTATAPANANVAPPGHYMLFVINSAGVPSEARIIQVGGGGSPVSPLPPAAPSGLTATAVNYAQIGLAWTDNSGNENAFHVQRCQGASCADYKDIATLNAGVTSYVSAALTASTSYSFRVRASNSGGSSGYSNTATATTAAPPPPPPPGPLTNFDSGKCMDVQGGSQASGAPVVIATCSGGANQQWAAPAPHVSGEVRVYGTMCLTVNGAGNNGDALVIATCAGQPGQQWNLTSATAGELKGINGKCAGVDGGATANGTPLILWLCDGTANQKWTPAPAAADQPPVAAFTYSCTALSCSFDSGSSTDDKGITSRGWSFGDGSTAGNVVTTTKTYAAAGGYDVTLTVTDAAGQTNSQTKKVTVTLPGISLTARGYKVKGFPKVDLKWSGATTATIDVFRDGAKIAAPSNSGAYTDNIATKGGGTYKHKVCEAGTTKCSNETTVTF